eukprot:654541-Hanusia_phi.AAC.1
MKAFMSARLASGKKLNHSEGDDRLLFHVMVLIVAQPYGLTSEVSDVASDPRTQSDKSECHVKVSVRQTMRPHSHVFSASDCLV